MKSFMLFDKNNSLEKEAKAIIKFSFEGNNYLVYSVSENEQNSQIFVSKLVTNSEGKNFIDNISAEEKSKLSNIVYNVIILLPTDVQKGNDFQVLVDNLTNKFTVKLLNGLPNLERQEYYNNCSIAITNKVLVDNALNLYNEKFNKVIEEIKQDVPTWTAPTEVVVPVPAAEQINSVPEAVVAPVQEPVTNVFPETVVVQPQTPVVTETVAPATNPVASDSVTSTPLNNEMAQANPQVQKLAVMSDPSLGIVSQQPNTMQNKKAGYADTKYVVIGSVCLFLAIAVIIIAYILISNIS